MQPRFLVITSLDSKLIKPKKSLPNINLNAWLNKFIMSQNAIQNVGQVQSSSPEKQSLELDIMKC